MKAPGPLLIVSGPSGTGKTTVIKRLLALGDLPLHLSVSATTRPPRPGEQEGVDYYFWDPGRFRREVDAGAFLEWAKVHGHCYGTLRREVDDYRNRGAGVILDIDVQGAAQVRALCPDCVSIFIKTSSWEAYEQRLRKRGESAESIARRLDTAKRELQRSNEFDHVVINDDLESAVTRVRDLIARAFHKGEE